MVTTKKGLIWAVLLFLCFGSQHVWASKATGKTPKVWATASAEIMSPGFTTYPVRVYGNPFSGNYRSILHLAPELSGLTGIRLPVAGNDLKGATLKLKFDKPVKLLVGITPLGEDSLTNAMQLRKIDFKQGLVPPKPALENALSMTELPAFDVYAVSFKKGEHEIVIPPGLDFQLVMLGATPSGQSTPFRNVALAGATDYPAFCIDGFADEAPVFAVIGGPDQPVVAPGSPGTEGIQGGFEGGSIVKIDDVYHMFPTERAGEKGVERYYDRVKTRVGHWTSKDAIHWTRQSTILQSSGVYALVPEDNPMNDRRSALWSYMPVFNKEKNRWNGFYLAYTTDFDVEPNHSFGRIWRCESEVEGINGIGGPYRDMGIVIEPGLDSQLWEGRQGVASFFPFEVKDGWHAFISGAYPFKSKADYPLHGGKHGKAWYVGLAQSKTLEGPWTRMDETINPVTSIHPRFVENPIVSRLPNGLYIAVYDGGPDYLKLPNKIGYTLSKDGLNWSPARYIAIDAKVNRWWKVIRTPLCLIPEGDNVYTIVYTAWTDGGRFHPIGMVQVKLNPEALEAVTAKL